MSDTVDVDSDSDIDNVRRRGRASHGGRGGRRRANVISSSSDDSNTNSPAAATTTAFTTTDSGEKALTSSDSPIGHSYDWLSTFHNSCTGTTQAAMQPPIALDIPTATSVDLPKEWSQKAAASRAARGIEFYGRLVGSIDVSLVLQENSSAYEELTKGYVIDEELAFDQDGEFSVPPGQIPISYILDAVQLAAAEYATAEDKAIVKNLYALQSPQSSQWDKPFLRLVSRHSTRLDAKRVVLSIEYFVYFSRLVFELISDPAICFIVSKLRNPPVEITPVKRRQPQPKMFRSTDADELLTHREYRFSLTGIMKYAENEGYCMATSQPEKLTVELYDFQRSTYQWLLDQEHDPDGLNAFFWECWAYTDGGGPMYYFPLAGEFRFEKPPLSRGGLLCEMGLGKTVEMISLILGNPSGQPRSPLVTRFVDIDGNELLSDPAEEKRGPFMTRLLLGEPAEEEQHGDDKRDFKMVLVNGGTDDGCEIINDSSFQQNALQNLYANVESKPMRAKNVKKFISTRATLIVVPRTLLQQWWRELHTRVNDSGTEAFSVINLADLLQDLQIPLNDVRDPDLKEGHHHFLFGQRGADCRNPRFCKITERIPGEWGAVERDEFPRGVCEFRLPGRTPAYKTYLGKCSYHRERFNTHLNHQMVTVKPAIDLELNEYDVVLTTYESFRTHGKFYKRYHWHRVILDECQEIKKATSQVAALCADLPVSNRWLVSGTPLCSRIEDLHGELNFLKVWPFSLSNEKDGFWDNKIGKPFQKKKSEALNLLQALLDIVMMRHSKSQRFLDGRPLILLPARTIEWRSFPMVDACDSYLKGFLESFAADALTRFLARTNQTAFAAREGDEGINAEYQAIKSLLVVINRCITHPRYVSLSTLDHLKRVLETPNVDINVLIRQIAFAQNAQEDMPLDGNNSQRLIPFLAPELILQHVRQAGQGAMGQGALNRATNRNLAPLQIIELEKGIREKHESWALQDLREEFLRLDLPIPLAWTKLDIIVNIKAQSNVASVEDGSELPKAGDQLRIKFQTRDDAEVNVTAVSHVNKAASSSSSSAVAYLQLDSPWTLETAVNAPVFQRMESRRRERYVDILVTTAIQRSGIIDSSMPSSSSSHAGHNHGLSGFASLYKLMAGEAVDCPLCLNPTMRPVVTSCVHVYCYICILQLISADSHRTPKCPICRRQVTLQNIMEADLSDVNLQMTADDPSPTVPVQQSSASPQSLVDGSNASIDGGSSMNTSSGSNKRGQDGNESVGSDIGPDAAVSIPNERGQPASKRTRRDALAIVASGASNSDNAHSETVFIVPDFDDCSPNAMTTAELLTLPQPPEHQLLPRNVDFPSLPPVFLTFLDYYSNPEKVPSRMVAVLKDMKEVLTAQPFAKIVIFTQYAECVDAVGSVLAYFNSSQCRYTDFFVGKLKVAKVDSRQPGRVREANLSQFQTDITCNVVILTTGNAAVGLTLTVAHICYILEPMQNAAEEAQALSRVHRIGQVHEVRCVSFFAQDSVEERLIKMRTDDQNLTGLLSSTQSSFSLTSLNTLTAEHSDSDNEGDYRSQRRRPRQQRLGYTEVDQLRVLYGVTAEREQQLNEPNASQVLQRRPYCFFSDSVAAIAKEFVEDSHWF